MNHEREHDHDQSREPGSRSSDLATPGRASRSSAMNGPEHPVVSGLLMRKADADAGLAHDAEHQVARASGGGGQELPADLRERFESSLGTDLSSVRVHTGSDSQSAAAAVNARAYATGNDIHFGAGQFDPHSGAGQHLIAHEVAHTVQQRGGSPMRQHKLEVSSTGDHAEIEADRAADAMITGRPAAIGGASGSVLHRAEGEGLGAGGSRKITNKSVEASAFATVTKKLKGKGCELEFVGKAQFTGAIEFPEVSLPKLDGGNESSGNKDGKKAGSEVTVEAPPLEVYKALEKDIGKEGEAHAESDWAVEKITLVPGIKVGKETEQGEETKRSAGVSLAATAEIEFKNGKTAKVVGTLFGVKKESGSKPTFVGPSISLVTPEAKWQLFDKDLGRGCKATGAVTLGGTVTARLSAEAITKEVIQKFEEQLLEKGAEAAAEEAAPTGLAALDAAALLEIGGFAAIAASVGVEFVLAAKSITEIKHAAAAGERAVEGYVAGALSALGCQPSGKGDPVYFRQGAMEYGSKARQVTIAVLGNPEVQKYKFTYGEVHAAVLENCRAHQAELAGKILGTARPVIAKAFADAVYKAENDPWYTMESDARRSAEAVARRMGVTDLKFGNQADE